VWVSTAQGRERALYQRVRAAEWAEADLDAYAGQQVRIELRCPEENGFWFEPQVVTGSGWLWPYPPPPSLTAGPPSDWPVAFGEQIELLGSALNAQGDALRLELYWHATQRVGVDYTVFVHLVDGAGTLVAGADGQPVHGAFPTTLWTPELVVVDARTLALPADLPPGKYHVAVGLYDLATLARLPAVDVQGDPLPNDALIVAEIGVE